jgi:hypothetical protein
MRGASVGVCVGTLTDWHRRCDISSVINQCHKRRLHVGISKQSLGVGRLLYDLLPADNLCSFWLPQSMQVRQREFTLA